MALKKAKKKVILDKVSDVAKSAKSVVFVNFHGLTVKDSTDLRRKLRTEGVGYSVAKKSLAKKAFAGMTIAGEIPELVGELAIAYAEDLTAPAREIYAFEKKHEGKIAILGGVFEGKYMNKAQMSEIAMIPPRETLIGMFVNLINSPIQRVVIGLGEIAKKKTV